MIRKVLLAVLGTVLGAGLFVAGSAGAQPAIAPAPAPAAVPQSREQVALSFAPVVRQTAPAVVNIFTRRVVRERAVSPLIDDPFFRRFFGDALPQGPRERERVQNSLGSGVIVSPDGLIVTNDHVIKGADEIQVVLNDRREFDARLVAADPRTDLAILRIDPGSERLPALPFADSDALEVGDLVLAIGNPFGVGQTVTMGIVSAVARTGTGISDYNFFIQTDAAINPGNSGGALVTVDGRLAGINTAIFSRSGGSIGIGFAIPASMVRTVVAAATTGGRLVRPWLGIAGQPVTSDIAQSLGLPRPAGVLVNGVDPGSPAERAGLRRGDIVTAVQGRSVDDPDALRYRFATLPIGSQAALSVTREGRTREVALAVAAPPEDPPRETTPIQGRNPFAGAQVANLSPALLEEVRLPTLTARQGVVVLDVAQASPAARIGLRPGDVVLRLNGRDVRRVRDLVDALRQPPAQAWQVQVRRGDQTLNTNIPAG
ncbi:MAG: DegQ family serine endoprotease [Rhodospirillales bacterium]|jgi:Do/DeqQ family serine protease